MLLHKHRLINEASSASVTLPEDIEAGALPICMDPALLKRSLVVGDRIVFKFNPPHGEGFERTWELGTGSYGITVVTNLIN